MRIGFISRASALKRSADKGGESTTGASNATAQTDTEAGASGAPNGAQSSSTQTEKTFTQAELEAVIEQRLTRERNKAKADADKAKADAEQRALVEQGEWKTLAEQRAQRVAELEPLSAQVEQHKSDAKRYRDAIAKYADAAKANVPESVRALLDKLDPIDQLDWITTNAASLTPDKTDKAQPIGTPQNKQTPKPNTGATATEQPVARVRF